MRGPVPIYLDHCATTPMAPQAVDAVVQSLTRSFANPSSRHRPGQIARAALEAARATVAKFVGASYPSEVHFTSGATESIKRSFVSARDGGISRFIVGATEHAAVLEAAEAFTNCVEVLNIPVDQAGRLSIDALEIALRPGPAFVSIGLVNNETGVLHDVASVAAACRRAGATLHIDAAQAVGRVDVNVAVLNCDYLSLSAHKFYGPKGSGVWFVRSGSPIARSLGHEGTPSVATIAGTAAAIMTLGDWQGEMMRQGILRDELEAAVLDAIPYAAVNGTEPRAASISNIYFPQRSAADLVEALSQREVYVSAGAACSTGGRPSHVIQAMGFPAERANGSVRFSLGRNTTRDEIRRAASLTVEAYRATLPLQAVA